MKCGYCGQEMQDTDSACPFCGTPAGALSPVERRGEETGDDKENENAGSLGEEKDSFEKAPALSEPELSAGQAALQSPKKKSGGKIAAIAVAAAAVAGIGIFGATRLVEKDPKEVVITAFENIYTEDQVKPMEELFGLAQFQEYSSGGNQQVEMEIVLEDCSEEEAKMLAGGGIRTEFKCDWEKAVGSFNMGVLFNNMDLVNMDFYYGDETLMAAIPELSSKVFTVDLSDGLAERLKNSEILGPTLQYSDVDIEGLEDFYHEYSDWIKKQVESGTASDPYGIQDAWKRFKEGSQAQENFKAALTVEKAGKGTFQIDGKEVHCKGYQVYVSKDSMIQFLRTSSDFFLQDEALKEKFLENLKMSIRMVELTGGDSMTAFGGMTPEELVESNYEDLKESVDDMIDQLDQALSDVEMLVHVDKKGRLASVEGTTVITNEGQEAQDIRFDLKLQGGSYLTQNALASLDITKDGKTMTVNMTKQGTYDGTKLTGDLAFDIHEEGEMDGHLFMGGTYNNDGGDFTLQLELGDDGGKMMGLSTTGVVSELEKGTVIHMDFDEIRFEMPGVSLLETDGEEFYITLGGQYDIRPLVGEVTEPEGEKLDVLAATEADWQNVMMEAYMGIMDIASQVSSVME
ncbi:MAG: zinc ribbon domain-containing protein [Lachnospiraceae bacterium]|jgi:hypothetical protein|nr:zinc ribbon domain-containing protein [Lachnospiraceae bacterium]